VLSLGPLFSLLGNLPRDNAPTQSAQHHPDRPQRRPADNHPPNGPDQCLALALLLHHALAGMDVVVVVVVVIVVVFVFGVAVRSAPCRKLLGRRDREVKTGSIDPGESVLLGGKGGGFHCTGTTGMAAKVVAVFLSLG